MKCVTVEKMSTLPYSHRRHPCNIHKAFKFLSSHGAVYKQVSSLTLNIDDGPTQGHLNHLKDLSKTTNLHTV